MSRKKQSPILYHMKTAAILLCSCAGMAIMAEAAENGGGILPVILIGGLIVGLTKRYENDPAPARRRAARKPKAAMVKPA